MLSRTPENCKPPYIDAQKKRKKGGGTYTDNYISLFDLGYYHTSSLRSIFRLDYLNKKLPLTPLGPRFCDSITLYILEGSQYKAKKEKYSLHVNIRNQHTHIMSANFGIKDTASEMCTFFSNKLERIINLDTL